MDLHTISFLFGAVLVAVAILGGGFEVKEIKVPKVGGIARFLSAVVGIVFVTIGVWGVLPHGPNGVWWPGSPPSIQNTPPENPNPMLRPESATWFVQVGTYKIRAHAEQELRELTSSGLDGLSIVVAKNYEGLPDENASYVVYGPVTQAAAEEFLGRAKVHVPQAWIRNAFVNK